MTNETSSPVGIGSTDQLGPTAVDAEHLLRFMCNTWVAIDAWAREHCSDADAIGAYPVIQGTANQIKLMRIGAQPFDTRRLQAGMQWMLRPNVANEARP